MVGEAPLLVPVGVETWELSLSVKDAGAAKAMEVMAAMVKRTRGIGGAGG